MSQLYKQQGQPFNGDALSAGLSSMTQKDQGIVTAQVDRVDTNLRRRRAESHGDSKTGFGGGSGYALMAALGVWFAKLEREDTDQYRRLKRWFDNRP